MSGQVYFHKMLCLFQTAEVSITIFNRNYSSRVQKKQASLLVEDLCGLTVEGKYIGEFSQCFCVPEVC